MFREVIFKDTIRGTVDAVNQLSAEAQFKWLLEHKECFCKKHCDIYYKDYLGAADYDLYFNIADKGLFIYTYPRWMGYY